MTAPQTIARIAVIQVCSMLASAIVLCAAAEAVSWACVWNAARKGN